MTRHYGQRGRVWFTTSQSPTARKGGPAIALETVSDWSKYLQENTLKVATSLMLFVGGLFVLIYFVQIQFLPEIDFGNATALLASVALVGLFVSVLLGAVFIVPGLVLNQLVQDGYIPSPTKGKERVDSSADKGRNSVYPRESSEDQNTSVVTRGKIPWQVWLSTWVAPVGIVIVIWLGIHAGKPCPEGTSFCITSPLIFKNLFAVTLVGATVLGLISFVMLSVRRARVSLEFKKLQGTHDEERVRVSVSTPQNFGFWRWTLLICIWWVAGAIVLLPFLDVYRGPNNEFWILVLTASWLAWVGFSNILWGYSAAPPDYRLATVIGGLSLFALVMIGSNPSSISTSVVRKLGLGGVDDVQLSVTAQGCAVVRNAAGRLDACGSGLDKDSFVVPNANLLSRIGAQYLIEVPTGQGSERVRVVIRKEDVLAWSRGKTHLKSAPSEGLEGNSATSERPPGQAGHQVTPVIPAPSQSNLNLYVDDKWIGESVSITDNSVHFQLSPTAKFEIADLIRNTIDNRMTLNFTNPNNGHQTYFELSPMVKAEFKTLIQTAINQRLNQKCKGVGDKKKAPVAKKPSTGNHCLNNQTSAAPTSGCCAYATQLCEPVVPCDSPVGGVATTKGAAEIDKQLGDSTQH